MSLDVDDELIQVPLNDVEKNGRDASGIDNFRKNAQLIFYCEAYMDGDARARMLMPQVMELNESKNEKPFFPSGAIFSLRCYSCVTPDFGLSSTGS